jgi:hypothetical protein
MIVAVLDTVGGTPCLIFYRDGKPLFTLWGDYVSPRNSLYLPDTALENIRALIETTKALGMSGPEIKAAVETYLKENGCT